MLEVQVKESAQVKVIAIYYDPQVREHVLWYYPVTSSSMVFG
jgi:hypothetical protein